MNPVEEYLNEYGCKTAGMLSSIRNAAKRTASLFPDQLGSGLAAAGATAAIGGVGYAANHIYNAATKARDFKKMLEFNPDLASHHQENPKYIDASFSTLRSLNPAFSKDPLVAGAFVRQMSEAPEAAFGMAADSLKAAPMPSIILQSAMQAAQQATRPDSNFGFQERVEDLKHKYQMQRMQAQNRFDMGLKQHEATTRSAAELQGHKDKTEWEWENHFRNTVPQGGGVGGRGGHGQGRR